MKKVGAYHNYLHNKIYEKKKDNITSDGILIIKRDEFKKMLSWYNIPLYIHQKFIQEMIDMGLVKIKNKQKIILINKNQQKDDWFY